MIGIIKKIKIKQFNFYVGSLKLNKKIKTHVTFGGSLYLFEFYTKSTDAY